MTELETALIAQDWGHAGYVTRPQVDQLMKNHSNIVEANALWEQYCPWSNTNGGYIKWIQK